MLSQMERNLRQEISDMEASNLITQMQIDQERELMNQTNKEIENLFKEKPEKVIGNFEKKLDADFKIFNQMIKRLDELDNMISIAKIEHTQMLEEACFLQSQLDSY